MKESYTIYIDRQTDRSKFSVFFYLENDKGTMSVADLLNCSLTQCLEFARNRLTNHPLEYVCVMTGDILVNLEVQEEFITDLFDDTKVMTALFRLID